MCCVGIGRAGQALFVSDKSHLWHCAMHKYKKLTFIITGEFYNVVPAEVAVLTPLLLLLLL